MRVFEAIAFLKQFDENEHLSTVLTVGGDENTDQMERIDEFTSETAVALFENMQMGDSENDIRSAVRSVLDTYGPVRESKNGPKLILSVINVIQDELTKNLVAHIQTGNTIEDWND